jgi:hypothetical protein
MPGRQAEHLPCGVNLHRFRLLRCTLDFRFGSFVSVPPHLRHVRFPSDSDQKADMQGGLLGAISDIHQDVLPASYG